MCGLVTKMFVVADPAWLFPSCNQGKAVIFHSPNAVSCEMIFLYVAAGASETSFNSDANFVINMLEEDHIQ